MVTGALGILSFIMSHTDTVDVLLVLLISGSSGQVLFREADLIKSRSNLEDMSSLPTIAHYSVHCVMLCAVLSVYF